MAGWTWAEPRPERGGPAPQQGHGDQFRKRHLGVDTLGLLLAVWVTAASVRDNVGGLHLLSQISAANLHVI